MTRFEVRCGSALSTSPTDQCVNCIGVEVVAIGGRQSECAHGSWLLFMLRNNPGAVTNPATATGRVSKKLNSESSLTKQ